jgi:putative transposase
MPSPAPLGCGCVYHVYNRGTDGENLFREERNYRFFLQRYAHYIEPVAETYAYCLLRNHFHALIRTLTPEEQENRYADSDAERPFKLRHPSRQFGALFCSYALACNKAYGRGGSLFEHPFHRRLVGSEPYFTRLVVYINRNAERHGLVDDYRDWLYASYRTLISSRPTHLQRDTVLSWFGGRDALVAAHAGYAEAPDLGPYLLE